MHKYIYIHGFGSSGRGSKANVFREQFQDAIIAPSLSYVPDLAIDTLKQLIEQLLEVSTVTMIGSSLGGYYATYLAEHYGIKAVLINPTTDPDKTLMRVLGTITQYYDQSHFEWNEKHISMLSKYATKEITSNQYLLLLQTGDKLLDYALAQKKYEHALTIIEEGGSHSYENIESKFEMIEGFAHRSSYL